MSTRAGFVALVGLPNAGKSTLLNRVLGEKVSIASPKPQTTRRRVAGILTRVEAQLVLVDTPGLLDPTYPLQRALAEEVSRSLEGVDLVHVLRDATGERELHRLEAAALAAAGAAPVFLVLNKTDLLEPAEATARLRAAAMDARFAEAHAVSAASGAGIEPLIAATLARLPESRFFYDSDQLTDRSMRFLTAELVRETLFEELEQELPYASHVEVTDYDEAPDVPRIEAAIHVERESQKGIVIGRGGGTLKRIGIRSREKIEGLAGRQVFLQLRVKVRPNWRRKDADLRRFGFRE